jgi:hypothetical protein
MKSLDWIEKIQPRDAAVLVQVWEAELVEKTQYLQEGIKRLRKAAGLDDKLVSGYFESVSAAWDAIVAADDLTDVHVIHSSGKIVADRLGSRYWLNQVKEDGPSVYAGKWYWLGPDPLTS